MGRRALLLIAAILVAATGTGVVALYARSADQRAGQQQDSVTVLVATKQIEAGAQGQDLSGAVEKRSYARAFVPPDAIISLDTLRGLVATATIPVNRPLQRSLFSSPANLTTINILGLSKDTVAVSVPMPDTARVAGYVTSNAYVALYVVGNGGGKEAADVRPLLNRPVRVITVAPAGATAPTPGQTLVTLELSLGETTRVIYASQKDSLYMALLPSKDVDLTNVPPFDGNYAGTSD